MATRYIDFIGGNDANDGLSTSAPWKHVKGMAGASGTANSFTPAGGDTIILKGGITWPVAAGPWTLLGGSSSAVTYTTDHSWFSGGSWSQPVIDAEHSNPGAATGWILGRSWTIFDDINLIQVATSMTFNSSSGIFYDDCHDVTISNCTFQTDSQRAILFSFSTAGSYSNFTFSNCSFTRCASAVWMGTTAAGISLHTLRYHDCVAFDFTTQIGGGVHGDGFFHYFTSSSGAGSTEYFDDAKFWNLKAYGDFRISHDPGLGEDMTALWFSEGPISGELFNCDFSFSGVQYLLGSISHNQFQNLISISGRGQTFNFAVYNSCFVSAVGVNQMSTAVGVGGCGSGTVVTFKNNIVSNPQYGLDLDASARNAWVSDHNIWNVTDKMAFYSDTETFRTYAQYQADDPTNNDPNSIMGSDPIWVDAPDDDHIQSSSPAIAAGENLTSLGISELDSDYDGLSRGSSWSIGPYMYAAAPAVTGRSVTMKFFFTILFFTAIRIYGGICQQ